MERAREAEMAVDDVLGLMLRNPLNREILNRLSELGLNDAWLVAGGLYQAVWNVCSGRPVAEGIKDYDIFYFDDRDMSWEAEDAVIKRVSEAFDDLGAVIDVKNQARVHLWYEQRFGEGYPKLRSSRDGIDRFLVACTRVAVRPSACGPILYAPDGLGDLFNGVLRPNPLNWRSDLFVAKAKSYQARWPWLRIVAD